MRTVFLFLLITFFFITNTYADVASKIINNLEKKTLSDTIKNIEIFLFHENF